MKSKCFFLFFYYIEIKVFVLVYVNFKVIS